MNRIQPLLTVFTILVPGILGLCLQPPIKSLPLPCNVRNLTIIDSGNSRKPLSSDYICNGTVRDRQMLDPPRVNFSTFSTNDFPNSTFLLTAVDITARQVLWLVGNITTNDTSVMPSPKFPTAITIKPYQRPIFNLSSRAHQIEFYVFEEKYKNNLAHSPLPLLEVRQPFDLTKWLEKQTSSGNKICGPVAAAQFVVVEQSSTSSNNNNYYGGPQSFNPVPVMPLPNGFTNQNDSSSTNYHDHHHHHHHHYPASAGNNNNSNNVLNNDRSSTGGQQVFTTTNNKKRNSGTTLEFSTTFLTLMTMVSVVVFHSTNE